MFVVSYDDRPVHETVCFLSTDNVILFELKRQTVTLSAFNSLAVLPWMLNKKHDSPMHASQPTKRGSQCFRHYSCLAKASALRWKQLSHWHSSGCKKNNWIKFQLEICAACTLHTLHSSHTYRNLFQWVRRRFWTQKLLHYWLAHRFSHRSNVSAVEFWYCPSHLHPIELF